MSTVVYTPAAVSTVENVSLSSHTRHIIQPDRSSAGAVSVSQCLANVPVQMCKLRHKYNLAYNSVYLRRTFL